MVAAPRGGPARVVLDVQEQKAMELAFADLRGYVDAVALDGNVFGQVFPGPFEEIDGTEATIRNAVFEAGVEVLGIGT